MAVFVPPVVGGVVAGAAAYQAWNPAKKQAPESKNAPRNGQDWRLGPTTDNLKLSDYWRNHTNRPTQPVEDAYRSTYDNMYTNGPKLMADSITGQLRWITPDGNSTNSTIIDHPGFGQETHRPMPPVADRSARNKKPYSMPTK